MEGTEVMTIVGGGDEGRVKNIFWTSLAVQWLGLCASTAGDTGLILGRGTKIPHATWRAAKKQNKTNKKKNVFEVSSLFELVKDFYTLRCGI